MNNGVIDFTNVNYISKEDYLKFSLRSNVENEDILFAMIGSIGNPVIVKKDRDFSIKNVALFKKSQHIITKYLYFYLYYIQDLLKSNATGAVQSFVSLLTLRLHLFVLPPLAEQKRIVTKIDKLIQLCEELEIENNIARESSSELFQSIMQNYFTPNKSSNEIIDLKFKRAVLSAKIINDMYEEKYFGAVKLEKILYLCETHLGVTLDGKYKKEAAGPYDALSRYEIERILKNKKWFDVNKEQKSAIANFYISGEMGFKIDMFTKMGAEWPVRPFIDISILDLGYSFTHGLRFVPFPRFAIGVTF